MASIHDESPPDKKRRKPIRKFKGPNDVIKKTAVVLREEVVFKREGTDEVFMPTTITMSNDINPNPELRKEISFTKSMKPDEVKEVLKNTFPVLANTERFYCAKAVQKEKLDFCGERRVWSGEVLNREIKGHSVAYIYCEEVNSGPHTSLIAPVENMQITRNESSSEDCRDSGFETCNTSQGSSRNQTDPLLIGSITRSPEPWHEFRANPDVELFYPLDEAEKAVNGYGYSETDDSSGDAFKVASTSSYDPESEGTMQDTLSRNYNSSDQRRVPLLHNNITNSPADGAFDEDISNLDIQLLFSMQEDLEKTYQNYESSDNSIFGVPCEAVPVHSNVESEEAYHSAEQENSNSNVEAEEANYGAEQGNLIQKIGPSSGPVEGGGNFLITVSEELPDCIDSGFAYFGSNHAVLTKLNKFTFEGRIPAAQQPGVVRVCVYSDTNRFLGETDFEYEDMMDRVAFHAVQLGSEGVSKLYALMAKHSINMWNQSSSVKQISELSGQATGAMNDSCQERSSLAEDIVIADENDDLAQDLQDLINWLSEENYHPVHTNRGMWLKISKVANGLCKKLAFSEDVDPQESEEDYFADAENSSCTSSDDDDGASLSDLAGWSECLNDSPLSLPLVYTRLSKSQEANPKAESTQHLNKPVNIGLDVSHGIPATMTEGFTSEPSIGDNKYVGSGDFLEWNTPPPESKKTKVNAVNEDQDTEQDLSQEWVFSSEESTSCTRLASQYDNSMLDLPGIDVDIKGSLYQDDELLKRPHTENAKSQNLELSLSITSMQKSATHDGPSTQDATQSPSKDPLQNGTGNRNSNVVPSQYSNKDITDNSEGLDSWFDPCEIEDGGKNEHSRWEMLSIEPNNTDGGVEEDNLDREQEHGLFSEEENLYTHLPLPDDTSVQSLGPEVENKESQDSPMLVRRPSFMLPVRIKETVCENEMKSLRRRMFEAYTKKLSDILNKLAYINQRLRCRMRCITTESLWRTNRETELESLRRRMSEGDTKKLFDIPVLNKPPHFRRLPLPFPTESLWRTNRETELKSLCRRKFEADTKGSLMFPSLICNMLKESQHLHVCFVVLRDKKTASLPKRSRKMLMTLTEIGFNYLRLSPRWEQFKPCIMDESPGDHSKTRHDFKPTSKRMDRGTLTAVGNAKRGHYVVVEIEKTHPSVAASTIYGREINEGSRLGQAFQLATKDLKDTWDEVEVKAESVQIGSVVKYVQVGDGFVFQGNTKRPRQLQDADKVLSDLSPVDGAHRGVEDSAPNYSKILAEESCQWDISEEGSRVDKRFQLWTNYLEVFLESILALRCADGLHRGVEDAFPNAYILAEGNYEDCTPKELSRLTKVENEAISVFTKLGKPLNLKLNCVENLTLLIPTTALELSHVEDTEDVADGVFVEVAEPFLISGVDDLSKPPYPSICDGLSPRDEPKEIPVEAEKLEADPEEAASEDGEAF